MTVEPSNTYPQNIKKLLFIDTTTNLFIIIAVFSTELIPDCSQVSGTHSKNVLPFPNRWH